MSVPVRLVAAALAGLLVLAGCGGAGTVTSSAPASAATGPTPGQVLSHTEFVPRFVAGANAVTTGAFTMAGGSDGGGMRFAGVFDQSDPANRKLRFTVETQDAMVLEVVIVDGVTYTRAEGERFQRTPTPADIATEQLTPGKYAESVADDVTGVSYVGKETMAGVETDHYAVTTATSSGTVTMHVFLDDRDRPVHAIIGGGTITYTQLDEPVTITAPPADQVEG